MKEVLEFYGDEIKICSTPAKKNIFEQEENEEEIREIKNFIPLQNYSTC